MKDAESGDPALPSQWPSLSLGRCTSCKISTLIYSIAEQILWVTCNDKGELHSPSLASLIKGVHTDRHVEVQHLSQYVMGSRAKGA